MELTPTMIAAMGILVIVFLFLWAGKSRSGFSHNPKLPQIPQNLSPQKLSTLPNISRASMEGSAFNNSQYQNSNPNVQRSYDYYKCIAEQCGGKTHDYDCLEMCHLQAFRKGMMEEDIKDMVCSPYLKDTRAYYRCLDSVYTGYRFPN
jgi:hypothetical protein